MTAALTKFRTQEEIRRKYPGHLEQYTFTLCKDCQLYTEYGWLASEWKCGKNLLPVTSDGQPCPYYIPAVP